MGQCALHESWQFEYNITRNSDYSFMLSQLKYAAWCEMSPVLYHV